MKAKIKPHKLVWFIHRIGTYVVKNGTTDMFNPPVKIASVMHAKALWITQKEKGYNYSETI